MPVSPSTGSTTAPTPGGAGRWGDCTSTSSSGACCPRASIAALCPRQYHTSHAACAALPGPHSRPRIIVTEGLRSRLRSKLPAGVKEHRHVVGQTMFAKSPLSRSDALAPRPRRCPQPNRAEINEPAGRWYCQRGLPKCTLHAPASLAHTAKVALFQHRPHLDGRREIQIAIAPAAQPALKLPRLSALALFRRQLAQFMLRPRNLPTGAIKMVRNPARPRPGSGGGYRGHPSRERAPLRRPAG